MLKNLKRHARRLKTETYALYLAYQDPRTPWYAKALAAFVVAHTFSPIDLIPDFIPILGYLDDLIIAPLGIALALRLIPPEVMAECRARAVEREMVGALGRWGMVIIIAIWSLFAILLIIVLFRFTQEAT
jgi:uncharacterized membrane protein YkvA (DUF1232 family)